MFEFKSAALVIAETIAETLRPPEPMAPSEWAAANLFVPDGPQAGEPFDLSLTPYLVEPLNLLGPDSPVNEIAVMKSSQTGFSTMLIAIVGYLIDRAPCRALLIQPTSDAASDFNRAKLDQAIRVSPALRRKVALQTSRSSEGSTTFSKSFPGGSLTLAIASSAADLRSKTVKVLLRDEIDQYPDDLDGQGNPLEISDARLISFLASGEWKKCDISTPTLKGGSKIERRYEAGDQRRYHLPCPGCGTLFVFEFGPNFRFEKTFPSKAYYVTPCCGTIVENHQKRDLLRRGRWIPGATRPGAFPSYHLDALSSPFVPWDAIAAEHVAAGEDPQRLKTFSNLWLGLPYEITGDTPRAEALIARREEGLKRGHIPPRGLILVGTADIQGNGAWYEIIAVAPTRETWVVDAGFLSGSTESPDDDVFEALKELLDRQWPDAFGRTRTLDAFGVDSGYRSPVVYAWTRANQRLNPLAKGAHVVLALKGVTGWERPPLGMPSAVDISFAGKRVTRGAKVRAVGIDGLKGVFMADLAKEGIKSGRESDPGGYCHFPSWLDETYFRQMTAEYLDEQMVRGRPKWVWRQRNRDNHFLDCRIYNMALIEYLGFSKMDDNDWADLAKMRGAPSGEVVAPVVVDQDAEEGEAAAVVAEVAAAPGRKMSWREMMERRANV
jgi:phage terminase large subunit GpA-like protein